MAAITTPVNKHQLLEFEVVFPHEKRGSPEEYLLGGSKAVILNSAAFFLGFKSFNSKFDDCKIALETIFGPTNNRLANEIYRKIKAVEKNGKTIRIFSAYTSLKLFETFFEKTDESETQTEVEFEVNLFKSYLSLNSKLTDSEKVAYETTKNNPESDEDLKYPMYLFSQFYPVSDTTNYSLNELWVSETIKAIYLFQYLESNPTTQVLLKSFLNHFNCETYSEYLKRILGLTVIAVKADKEAHTDIIYRKEDPNFNRDTQFIDSLSVSTDEKIDEYDFLSLRAKPFYKVSEGVYRIIFKLFVIEKLFKGVYFILRDINEKLPNDIKVKALKSVIGNDYSEKHLLYKTLQLIYSENCTSISGQQASEAGIEGEPDYYVRKGRSILIFESKDFLIPKHAKESFNYNKYLDEFEKKLYFENTSKGEKKKAVLQLIENVKRLLNKEFPLDTNYHNAIIYPILVVHDHQYDVMGFNAMVDYWFQYELEQLQLDGYNVELVRPLVVININSLIYHQMAFAKVPLHKILEEYIKHIRIPIVIPRHQQNEAYMNEKFIPFSYFLDRYVFKHKLRILPPLLKELGLTLFQEEI